MASSELYKAAAQDAETITRLQAELEAAKRETAKLEDRLLGVINMLPDDTTLAEVRERAGEYADQLRAEARDKALEEAAALFDKRASSLRSVPYADDAIPMTPTDMAKDADESAAIIRALKSNHESKDSQGGT